MLYFSSVLAEKDRLLVLGGRLSLNHELQSAVVEVASTLGHRQVEMAILCLGSLLRHSADALTLRLHDDGTLTGEDRERLAAGLRLPEIVSRSEADERAAEFLARY